MFNANDCAQYSLDEVCLSAFDFKKVLMVGLSSALLFISMPGYSDFARGADISWWAQQEKEGYVWSNDYGQEKPLPEILKEHNINAIRFRVWANPPEGWNSKNSVKNRIKLVKKAGIKDIMLSLHYSHDFADPGKQTKPPEWEGLSLNRLKKKVKNHTKQTLLHLKNAGIEPKWIQIGNETNNGMLWPEGRIYEDDNDNVGDFTNYHAFIVEGLKAAKSVFPDIKTIIHIANAQIFGAAQSNIDGLYAVDDCDESKKSCWKNMWDILGLSLYPDGENWEQDVSYAVGNMVEYKRLYGKQVMLTEFGMPARPVGPSYDALYSLLGSVAFYCFEGVFYWEPQGYPRGNQGDYADYGKHAWWGEDGGAPFYRPTFALDAFQFGGVGNDCSI